ncbi:hypothetical protein K9M74_00465 [Candidatus Woesearchaeota archaeon]|nr:hypothetical protein [Candidatus Woesearchaeota archaeon]
MNRGIFVVIVLLFIPLVSAANTDDVLSITLLSVSEQDNGTFIGGTAELYLQLRPGHGAIFIESYPLSKLDTQVATRLANEIACEFTTQDCNAYDFFYTLQADAPLIGGPSAGGATALLTLAALEDLALKDTVAMTGAISSGGIITPVGRVKEKILAASLSGHELVIVPNLSFSRNTTPSTTYWLNDSEINNSTDDSVSLNFKEFVDLPIVVEPVITLPEALAIATTDAVDISSSPFFVDKQYAHQMKLTSSILCNRSSEIQSQLKNETVNTSLYFLVEDFLNKSQTALRQEDYYARASFCYSANINLRELLVTNLSQDVKQENLRRLQTSIIFLEEQIDTRELKVFSDLETYFIVKERLLEAQFYIDEINTTNISSRLLALGIERYYSGVAWSSFFNLPGEPLVINEDELLLAALQEFSQVESRINYLKLYLPDYFLQSTEEQLTQAKKYFRQEEYGLALFKATKTRAELDAYLATFALTKENMKPLLTAKLARAQDVIASQQEFPLLGYSYFEYGTALADSEPSTALLYSEYALAFSDLDDYFSSPQTQLIPISFETVNFYVFFTGLGLGLLILVLRENFIKRRTKK